MAWRKVTFEQTPVHDFSKQKEVVGVLVNKRPDVGPNKSMMYEIEKPDHTKVSVWGSAGLDASMLAVNLGQEVKIEFKGEAVNPKTNRKFKAYEVSVNE